MADWLIDAATACSFPAQSTSIPGVAQRTGATTYYLEIYPAKRELLDGREPVMALTPSPGNVDVMVSSEFVEAGRALRITSYNVCYTKLLRTSSVGSAMTFISEIAPVTRS